MQKTKQQILDEAGYVGKRGRRKIGDVALDKIMVSNEIKKGLEEKAEKLGIKMPDARRKAYELFINSK